MDGVVGWGSVGRGAPGRRRGGGYRRRADAVAECALFGLGAEQAGRLLAGVVAPEARLAGLRLRLVTAAEAAGTAEAAGAPNTGAWLRGTPVLLCCHHHHVAHQGHWAIVMGADGRPEFIPPASIDPQRRPRRNTRWRRPHAA